MKKRLAHYVDFVKFVTAKAKGNPFVKPDLTAEYLNKAFLFGMSNGNALRQRLNQSVVALLITLLITFYKDCPKIQ